ncbi:hypothetical protein D9M71_516920 [compost metagenome]
MFGVAAVVHQRDEAFEQVVAAEQDAQADDLHAFVMLFDIVQIQRGDVRFFGVHRHLALQLLVLGDQRLEQGGQGIEVDAGGIADQQFVQRQALEAFTAEYRFLFVGVGLQAVVAQECTAFLVVFEETLVALRRKKMLSLVHAHPPWEIRARRVQQARSKFNRRSKRADDLAQGFHGLFRLLGPGAAIVQADAVAKALGRRKDRPGRDADALGQGHLEQLE